jgi:UDP-2-acetamido-3-amino-2,3-dideoxy-glucuronate N-acetyltransferase
MIHDGAQVHPTAFVHEDAEVEADCVIGANTRIWAHACVMRGSQIGSDVVVGRYAHIEGARVGNRCKIENNVYIPPGVRLHNEVFVGPHAAFANDRYPRACPKPGEPPFTPRGAEVLGGASIGMKAVVGAEVTIGERAMVGMGAIVPKDVAAGATVYGPKPEYSESGGNQNGQT